MMLSYSLSRWGVCSKELQVSFDTAHNGLGVTDDAPSMVRSLRICVRQNGSVAKTSHIQESHLWECQGILAPRIASADHLGLVPP